MLNHITIMGRLVRDPELRRTGTGTAVTNFTVAVDRDYSGKDGGEKKTDFINCVAWRQTGEFVSKYFTKGSMIVVSGRLELRDWTDKDGNKRTSAEINVENAYFGSTKKESEAEAATPVANEDPYAETNALIQKYQQGTFAPDYAMLQDDDSQLPF